MARRRTLRPEEEELWDAVARTAKAMHPLHPKSPEPRPPLVPPVLADPKPAPVPRFRIGERTSLPERHDILPGLSAQIAAAPLRMDAKNFARMSRGKLVPEARIDLHGMTLAEAHPELIRFILNAHAAGLRLVLVITGKGKRRADDGPIPQRQGILRHQVPQWLRLPPLAPCVLQVAEAHLKHGGSGAYYVYLKRAR